MKRRKRFGWLVIMVIMLCLGGSSVQTFAKDIVVVLDPGHGGHDPGAIGYYGGQEKKYNLKIAQYCRDELKKYGGIKVIMTRDSDTYLTLNQRSNIAVKNKADFFISFHNNAIGNSSTSGSLVYITQSNYQDMKGRSTKLANYILDGLEELGLQRRGTYTRNNTLGTKYSFGGSADYYSVISGCVGNKIPGMIIEHAFVTSKTDSAKFLDNESKLKEMGQADARAIAKYFGLDAAAVYPSNLEFSAREAGVNIGKTITLKPVFTPKSVVKNTLKWKTSNKGIATVSSKGVVKGVAEGQAIITATTANGYTAFCKVDVKKAARKLTISSGKLTVNVGTNNKKILSSWMEPTMLGDNKLTYKSSDTSVAKVDAYGVITGVSEGEATITVTNANQIKVNCDVTVTHYTTRINMKRSAVKVSKGYKGNLKDVFGLTVTPSGSVEDWEIMSDDGNVIALWEDLTFSANEDGYSIITMKTASGCINYGLIIVEDGVNGYENITESHIKDMFVGEKEDMTSWNKGEITYVECVDISVEENSVLAENPGYGLVRVGEVLYMIKVTNPQVTKITTPMSEYNMLIGSSRVIVPTVTSEPGTKVTLKWTSSNKNVATVDQNGVVKAVGNGDAKIYIDSKENGCGKKLGVVVHVSTQEQGIKLCAGKFSMPAGCTKYLTATFSPSSASNQDVSWSSSNTKVATVDANGKVTGKKAGTVVITGKSVNGFRSSCTITITPKVKSISIAKKVGSNQSTIYLKKGKTTKIVTSVKPANVSQSIYRVSSHSSIVSISSKGVIKAKKKGSATITFITKDGTIQKKVKVNVVTAAKKAKSVKLASTKLKLKVGETVQLKATISPKSTTGNLSYSSNKKSVATVDAYGRVKGIKKGTAKITVKATGGKKKTCKITVQK